MQEKLVKIDKRTKRGDKRKGRLQVWIEKRKRIKSGHIFSKVCRKHPELKGERFAQSRLCLKCNGELTKQYRERNRSLTLEKYRIRAKKWRNANPGLVCELTIRRRSEKKQATPAWANIDHIKGMYELRDLFKKTGLKIEVDHIVPLRSKRVSGFHIENNLQLLVQEENLKKRNYHWPDGPTI